MTPPAIPSLDAVRHVHLCAVAGTGMGALAAMLKARGIRVTGSDQNVYPPMSTQLAEAGIEVRVGYRAENLEPRPDLVIVGNALSRGNPEIEALLTSGIPYVSFPDALGRFFLEGRHSLVIAGTHGKTTTGSLAAWLLEAAGEDPSFLIGGVPVNFGRGARIGGGRHFVVEGDEYDTAFFDKGSKFLHYRPKTAIVTSVEFDHADIFRDLDHVKSAFRRFVALVPPEDGLLVINADDEGAVDVASKAAAPVERYGLRAEADWTAGSVDWREGRARFDLVHRGRAVEAFELPLLGQHNLQNAIGVLAALVSRGLDPARLARGMREFRGVKRRQEVRGSAAGVTVLDDFAHHPTAVRVTLEAIRGGYPGRRLWAIFEPRSASSRRKVFQRAYVEAFRPADRAVIADVYLAQKLPEGERFDPAALAADLVAAGTPAAAIPTTAEIVSHVTREARAGDVVAVLSNGGFDGLHDKLLAALASRVGGSPAPSGGD